VNLTKKGVNLNTTYILYLKIGKKITKRNQMVWDSCEVGNAIVADTRRKMTCCSAALF
jgi:hypothetical protein